MTCHCLRLRKGNASGEGALMRICVQSIAPIVFGSPCMKVPLNLYLFNGGVWEFDVRYLVDKLTARPSSIRGSGNQ